MEQEIKGKVGRPKNSMKHLSPFTSKPIDAPTYYKEMRRFKRLHNQEQEKKQQKEIVVRFQNQKLNELIQLRTLVERLIQKEIDTMAITGNGG